MAGFTDRADSLIDVEVVPHPAVMVLFDLGDQALAVDDGNGQEQRGSVVAGLAPNRVRGQGQAGSFTCLQVRLSPLIARAVLGAASELSGAVLNLEDLWGDEAVRTQERLRAARSWDDRFAIAEVAFARRLDAGREVDPEVAFCWGRMMNGRGQTQVERLAAEVGWSRKRLWARFRSQIGITPKRAAQLIRFDHAAHRLAAGQAAAAVAVDSGYADQSHLHRDVMTFTGVTPATVASAPFLAVDDVAWPARP
ncbi:Helix-turn-helix domain-containing protein [Micromonospora phaseoli]|uniref:Helix-turn-helix domain-containing protein n=1 Tax=Micromonospora phaseoli TaxID=1144548 RepID=A0A1H7C244_9ACTN|nr:helix-turn-helix domain-containing protein [Micromonospora phaseoli]PZV92649.1 helix-turn-helix protein [Micromonospora phaseoli]GIJ76697.1 AraC family transcriptional regulator [Micromonospora phaseoli]SEJ83933.1 Helix-turn-helix domain-containing protein [Micromonospora phaseoli]